MDFLHAAVLSIVEGLTEFLPISSTGHLILASDILKVAQTDFVKDFEIIIQLGAILAVVVYYRNLLFANLPKKVSLWMRIIVAFIPTGILGLIFYKIIKSFLLGNLVVTLWALFLGGILFIVLERLYQEQEHHAGSITEVSLKKAFLIGLCQGTAMIPGVSRSGATIFGGLFLGLKRKVAVEFSFLLAIPTMVAATGLDLIKSSFAFTPQEEVALLIGFVGSFLTALLSIKYFLIYIQKHDFIPFGVYRIVLAAIFWLVLVR